MKGKEVNPYLDEIKRFIGKECEVKYLEGKEVISIKGKIRGMNFNHLNIVIMTDKRKIIIKHITTITRDRTNPDKGKKK